MLALSQVRVSAPMAVRVRACSGVRRVVSWIRRPSVELPAFVDSFRLGVNRVVGCSFRSQRVSGSRWRNAVVGVVEPFDVVEDSGSGLVPGGEAGPVEEFGFEGGEERLGYGVDAPIVKYWCYGVGRMGGRVR